MTSTYESPNTKELKQKIQKFVDDWIKENEVWLKTSIYGVYISRVEIAELCEQIVDDWVFNNYKKG